MEKELDFNVMQLWGAEVKTNMQKLRGGRFQLERMKIFVAMRNIGEVGEGAASQVKCW